MAKSRNSTGRHETGKQITTKSRFGSHADMVIEELEDNKVVCKDDRGTYVTLSTRLDNGLADPNRYSGRE